MLWLISAIIVLIGTLIQAVQAIVGYRRTFSVAVQTAAETQSQRLDDLQATLLDRIGEETARGAYLGSVDPRQELAEMWKQMGPTLYSAGSEPSLEEFLAEHDDEIHARVQRLTAEFAPFHEAAAATQERLTDRVKAQLAALEDFLADLPLRAAVYRRERRNIAIGWAIVAAGAAVNVAAAAQAM
jgi:hypothetical protein